MIDDNAITGANLRDLLDLGYDVHFIKMPDGQYRAMVGMDGVTLGQGVSEVLTVAIGDATPQ